MKAYLRINPTDPDDVPSAGLIGELWSVPSAGLTGEPGELVRDLADKVNHLSRHPNDRETEHSRQAHKLYESVGQWLTSPDGEKHRLVARYEWHADGQVWDVPDDVASELKRFTHTPSLKLKGIPALNEHLRSEPMTDAELTQQRAAGGILWGFCLHLTTEHTAELHKAALNDLQRWRNGWRSRGGATIGDQLLAMQAALSDLLRHYGFSKLAKRVEGASDWTKLLTSWEPLQLLISCTWSRIEADQKARADRLRRIHTPAMKRGHRVTWIQISAPSLVIRQLAEGVDLIGYSGNPVLPFRLPYEAQPNEIRTEKALKALKAGIPLLKRSIADKVIRFLCQEVFRQYVDGHRGYHRLDYKSAKHLAEAMTLAGFPIHSGRDRAALVPILTALGSAPLGHKVVADFVNKGKGKNGGLMIYTGAACDPRPDPTLSQKERVLIAMPPWPKHLPRSPNNAKRATDAQWNISVRMRDDEEYVSQGTLLLPDYLPGVDQELLDQWAREDDWLKAVSPNRYHFRDPARHGLYVEAQQMTQRGKAAGRKSAAKKRGTKKLK